MLAERDIVDTGQVRVVTKWPLQNELIFCIETWQVHGPTRKLADSHIAA